MNMNDTPIPAGGSPTRYFDKKFGIEAAKILPGEYFATDKDMVLVTVLGSCVAACIRDPRAGVGGMNHFMLPRSEKDPTNPVSMSARYGTFAMEILINQLIKMGARRESVRIPVSQRLASLDFRAVLERQGRAIRNLVTFTLAAVVFSDDDFAVARNDNHLIARIGDETQAGGEFGHAC